MKLSQLPRGKGITASLVLPAQYAINIILLCVQMSCLQTCFDCWIFLEVYKLCLIHVLILQTIHYCDLHRIILTVPYNKEV